MALVELKNEETTTAGDHVYKFNDPELVGKLDALAMSGRKKSRQHPKMAAAVEATNRRRGWRFLDERSRKPVFLTKTDKGKWVSDDTRKIHRFSRRACRPNTGQ